MVDYKLEIQVGFGNRFDLQSWALHSLAQPRFEFPQVIFNPLAKIVEATATFKVSRFGREHSEHIEPYGYGDYYDTWPLLANAADFSVLPFSSHYYWAPFHSVANENLIASSSGSAQIPPGDGYTDAELFKAFVVSEAIQVYSTFRGVDMELFIEALAEDFKGDRFFDGMLQTDDSGNAKFAVELTDLGTMEQDTWTVGVQAAVDFVIEQLQATDHQDTRPVLIGFKDESYDTRLASTISEISDFFGVSADDGDSDEEDSDDDSGDAAPYEDTYNLAIGDVGPAGGRIFFVESDQDKVMDQKWKYLEAAPKSAEVQMSWGPDGLSAKPASQNAQIGSGKENTKAIVEALEAIESNQNRAAVYCDNLQVEYSAENFDDWFLPSKDELKSM